MAIQPWLISCTLEVVFLPVLPCSWPKCFVWSFPLVFWTNWHWVQAKSGRDRVTWHYITHFVRASPPCSWAFQTSTHFQETGSGNSVSKLNGASQLDDGFRFLESIWPDFDICVFVVFPSWRSNCCQLPLTSPSFLPFLQFISSRSSSRVPSLSNFAHFGSSIYEERATGSVSPFPEIAGSQLPQYQQINKRQKRGET